MKTCFMHQTCEQIVLITITNLQHYFFEHAYFCTQKLLSLSNQGNNAFDTEPSRKLLVEYHFVKQCFGLLSSSLLFPNCFRSLGKIILEICLVIT